MTFQIALFNVLITLFYIIPGFIVSKMKKAHTSHLATMSAVLIYVCAPCMVISSFMSLDFSINALKNMGLFFVATFSLQAAFMGILYILFHKKYENAQYRILTIGAVLGNVGFFGLPLVRALLPNNPEVLCYSSIYVLTMNILVFTMGIYCLTTKKEYVSLKSGVFNPSMFGFVIGFSLYLVSGKNWIPTLLADGISLLGKMTTPLCMLILGIRLAQVPFKKLFTRPVIYLVCLGKLIVFPLFCFLIISLFPVPESFKISILVLSSTPCASVIFNLAEMHKSEEELSANCVLLTTLLCFLTIPVLTLLV